MSPKTCSTLSHDPQFRVFVPHALTPQNVGQSRQRPPACPVLNEVAISCLSYHARENPANTTKTPNKDPNTRFWADNREGYSQKGRATPGAMPTPSPPRWPQRRRRPSLSGRKGALAIGRRRSFCPDGGLLVCIVHIIALKAYSSRSPAAAGRVRARLSYFPQDWRGFSSPLRYNNRVCLFFCVFPVCGCQLGLSVSRSRCVSSGVKVSLL